MATANTAKTVRKPIMPVKAKEAETVQVEIAKTTPKKESAKKATEKPTSKTYEMILDLSKVVKNSVVYANALGQSIYLKNEYLENANTPPAQIKLTVTAV